MENRQIGLRIKGLRAEKGLTQEDLGKKLDIDRATVSKIERGENAPTLRILIKLRQLFSISLDWLITGSGTREIETQDKDVKELLSWMDRSPFLKHHILSEFFQLKLENPTIFGINKKSIRKVKRKKVKNERKGNSKISQ